MSRVSELSNSIRKYIYFFCSVYGLGAMTNCSFPSAENATESKWSDGIFRPQRVSRLNNPRIKALLLHVEALGNNNMIHLDRGNSKHIKISLSLVSTGTWTLPVKIIVSYMY